VAISVCIESGRPWIILDPVPEGVNIPSGKEYFIQRALASQKRPRNATLCSHRKNSLTTPLPVGFSESQTRPNISSIVDKKSNPRATSRDQKLFDTRKRTPRLQAPLKRLLTLAGARPASRPSTLRSSSKSGQWMPSPSAMRVQLERSGSLPCIKRGNQAKATTMVRPSARSTVNASSFTATSGRLDFERQLPKHSCHALNNSILFSATKP
jgi:hypothetical protein